MERVETEVVEKSEISNLERQEEAGEENLNINNLPEGCISDILSLTTPADACRSSLVSALFKSAANSDALWEKFLPADYQQIISRAFSSVSSDPSFASPVNTYSKKELYHRLCVNPILIDGGLKSFQLEKCSGKKYTPVYWRWLGFPGSRFVEVAQLIYVWWLEIRGKVETRLLSPKTLYGAYLVLKLTNNAYGFNVPVKARVEVVGIAGGGSIVCSEERRLYLDPRNGKPSELIEEDQFFAQVRGDGWMEVEVGHFYNEGEDLAGEVRMAVLETERGVVKSGLVVQGIELRPKVDLNNANP
ncbi:hypothetical protein MKW94_030722 [Papaver nudicaule]|uniref:F-box domain-containing protein n=1 Tax=Papaver nudicaule TaxID=74823 RepID=A0AA41RVH5_PAPNU|nr:hypothetical protein [Papaver nudicaule]